MTIEDDPKPIYASPMDVETYRLLELDKHGPKAVNGHSNLDVTASINHAGDAGYQPCPDVGLIQFNDGHIWIYIPVDLPAGSPSVCPGFTISCV